MSNVAPKLPGILGKIGKKQVEIATQWVGSALGYGTTATLLLFYFTDWKAVVTYVPYYNGKFKN